MVATRPRQPVRTGKPTAHSVKRRCHSCPQDEFIPRRHHFMAFTTRQLCHAQTVGLRDGVEPPPDQPTAPSTPSSPPHPPTFASSVPHFCISLPQLSLAVCLAFCLSVCLCECGEGGGYSQRRVSRPTRRPLCTPSQQSRCVGLTWL